MVTRSSNARAKTIIFYECLFIFKHRLFDVVDWLIDLLTQTCCKTAQIAQDEQGSQAPSALITRVGIVGGLGVEPPPQFVSTDAHFWVKIGFKFQSLGKISNI